MTFLRMPDRFVFWLLPAIGFCLLVGSAVSAARTSIFLYRSQSAPGTVIGLKGKLRGAEFISSTRRYFRSSRQTAAATR